MADTDLMIAYLGKVLGQMGAALGGNQQNLQQFGQQAAAANEGTIADIQQKKYEEEKKKQEDKGFWGDLLNIGGDVASVAFPEAAVPIQIATKAGSGAITGGAEGAAAGAAKAALPSVANIPIQASGTDGAAAGQKQISPAPIQPSQASAPAASAKPVQLDANGYPLPDTLEKTYSNPVPNTPSTPQPSLMSRILADPNIQAGVGKLVDHYTQPEKPHLSTLGLNPDTAMQLRQLNASQENADRQYNLDKQQAEEKTAYYNKQQAQEDKRLDIEMQRASKTGTPKPTNVGVVQLPDKSWAYSQVSPEGQVANIPLGSGVTPASATKGSTREQVRDGISADAFNEEVKNIMSTYKNEDGSPVTKYQAEDLLRKEALQQKAQFSPNNTGFRIVHTNQGDVAIPNIDLAPGGTIPDTNPEEAPSAKRLQKQQEDQGKRDNINSIEARNTKFDKKELSVSRSQKDLVRRKAKELASSYEATHGGEYRITDFDVVSKDPLQIVFRFIDGSTSKPVTISGDK